MLRITVLSENTAVRPGLDTEDGLSVFIETDRHKILMDAGWNDVFLNNAARLGAPVEEADAAVLSHGHYDHCLGLCRGANICSISPATCCGRAITAARRAR